VAVTPDELGEAWKDGKVHLPLRSTWNGKLVGQPHAGVDMVFNFPTWQKTATRKRQKRIPQKRLEKAREEGDVPRSKELATFAVLMTAGAGLWIHRRQPGAATCRPWWSGLSLDREQIFNPTS
jgi:hypothetical protein